jgi:hypothetical protein
MRLMMKQAELFRGFFGSRKLARGHVDIFLQSLILRRQFIGLLLGLGTTEL